MKTPAASGVRQAGAERHEDKTLTDRSSSASRPARQVPPPTDAPPAPWQHVNGPLGRVLADIARRVIDDTDRWPVSAYAMAST